MTERTILNDCCEDWIVQWGPFYKPGTAFACPECGTEWSAAADATFERVSDKRGFHRREREGGAERFPYLAAVDGQEPRVERCCTKILLTHGARMRDGLFVCPVCATRWTKRTERLHGLRVPVFEKQGLAEPLTIQSGRTRPFLVSMGEYSPPRD
jgi:uncharacterized Zn ribbon protein